MLVDYVRWLRFRGMSERTVKRRFVTLSRFLMEYPDPSKVTPQQAEEWLAGLGVVARSRRAYLYDLKSFYKWAVSRGVLAVNPVVDITPPQVARLLPRPAPVADLEVAIVLASDVRVRRAIMCGWMAGLRCEEVAMLHSDDVHDGQIHVLAGKGGKQRNIPLHPRLAVELAGVEGPVVGVKADTLTRLVSAHFESLNMPWTLHNCRHTFGTRLYQATLDVILVRDLMGHSSVQTTEGYARADGSKAVDAVALVA
jgi:site-specific recombinase XerC